MYSDLLTNTNKAHRFSFTLPTSLIGKPLKFVFTSVYNPIVNKNYPSVYNLTQVTSNVRSIIPEFNKDNEVVKKN